MIQQRDEMCLLKHHSVLSSNVWDKMFIVENEQYPGISFYSMKTHHTYSIQCMWEITHACLNLPQELASVVCLYLIILPLIVIIGIMSGRQRLYDFGTFKREAVFLNISVLYLCFGKHLILWLSAVINLMMLMVCEADRWSVSFWISKIALFRTIQDCSLRHEMQ